MCRVFCRVDPTFLASSSLYRKTNWDLVDSLYLPSERRLNLIPYGFFSNQGASMDVRPTQLYPVIFDVNLNASRALDFITFLRDGAYLDDQSYRFSLKLITFNPEINLFVFVETTCQMNTAGGYNFLFAIDTIDAEPYAPDVMWRLALEIMLVVMLFALVAIEVHELRETIVATGSPKEYLWSISNLIDLSNYAIQFAMLFLWISYAAACSELRQLCHARFHVYTNYDATGRYFAGEANGLDKALDFYHAVEELSRMLRSYGQLVTASLLLVYCQVILGYTSTVIIVFACRAARLSNIICARGDKKH